ncbi:MAG: trehalose-6-phosphate synthase [Chloroflexota bacterium]
MADSNGTGSDLIQIPDSMDEPLIVIASNRGPYSFSINTEKGELESERGTGGLVTALAALAERYDVLWVASALSSGDKQWAKEHASAPRDVDGITLFMIQHHDEAYHQYYNMIANPLLWFIQHEMWNVPRTPSINQDMWDAWEQGYVEVNRAFAKSIAKIVKDQPADRPIIVMPQDYHLYLVPKYLREELGDRVQIQPFLHIPWPGPDSWRLLPGQMRDLLLESMLEADRLGFQTKKDAFNFVQTLRFYVDGAHSRGSRDSIEYNGRKIPAKTYPISIDVEKVASIAEEPETSLQKNQFMSIIGDRKLILRVDRVEPSKNILRGLEAYRALLERYPEHVGKVQMMMLLVPSRMQVSEYSDYLQDIMATAGMINAEYSEAFWEPVRVVLGNNYTRAIAAMQLYDILLVNPIADGMNLVAKEGPHVNNRDGVLILSENAGAVYELGKYALTVSPFDTFGTANAMHKALTMNPGERHEMSEKMKALIQEADVRQWFAAQVQDAVNALESQARNSPTSSTPDATKSA